MEEGKLPFRSLEKLLDYHHAEKIEGVLQGPKVGVDVAVLDYSLASQRAQEFYQSSEEVLLVVKTDPITFPTANPGKSVVIINANDIVTSGALPFGFNITMVFPPGFSEAEVFKIQKNVQQTCSDLGIAVLGGHTEFSQSVVSPVLSGAMIGFVPRDFYVPRKITVGDVIVCVGFCAKEGMGIIAHEGKKYLQQFFSKSFLSKLLALGEALSVVDVALTVNKLIRPGLMHDATEGGILGAIYETIVPEGFGLRLSSEQFPLTKEAHELASFLKIDPLRLISSGTLVVVTSKEKAGILTEKVAKTLPIAVVGEVTKKSEGALVDGKPLAPPQADILITALQKITEGRKD